MSINNLSDKIVHTLKLPFKNDHGTNLIKSIEASTKNSLSENHDVRIIQHKHDLVYFRRCPSHKLY